MIGVPVASQLNSHLQVYPTPGERAVYCRRFYFFILYLPAFTISVILRRVYKLFCMYNVSISPRRTAGFVESTCTLAYWSQSVRGAYYMRGMIREILFGLLKGVKRAKWLHYCVPEDVENALNGRRCSAMILRGISSRAKAKLI